MNNKKLMNKATLLMLSAVMAVSMAGCSKTPSEPVKETTAATEKEYGQYEITLSKEDGASLSLLSPKVSEYLAIDDEDTDDIAAFLYNAQTDWYYSDTEKISWSNSGADSYDVLFSTDKELKNASVICTTDTEINLSECTFLYPGRTYYWKVIGKNSDGRGSYSETKSFIVKDETLRTVYVGGVENVRDMGGWKIKDSEKSIKYGMLYRGGRLNKNLSTDKEVITAEGIATMRDELGIITEVDLRGTEDNDGQTECVFGSNLNYLSCPIAGYDNILPGSKKYDKSSTESIRKLFEFMADENHYPMYIHCNYGADRTGTMAFLINGLLGVSYEDLMKDFELTSFTPSEKRWRSNIKKNDSDGSFTFAKDGIMQNDSMNYVAIGKLYDTMMEKYGKGTDLSGAIETYLTSVCGIDKTTISAVKKILVEEKMR